MSVCVSYIAVSHEFAQTMRDDETMAKILSQIMVYVPIQDFFTEIDEEEIAEITEGFDTKDVFRLQTLIEQSTFGSDAYSENTFDIHQKGICNYLQSINHNKAQELAEYMISGHTSLLNNEISYCEVALTKEIATLFDNKQDEVFACYQLAERYRCDTWQTDLKDELTCLINCYVSASQVGGEVWNSV